MDAKTVIESLETEAANLVERSRLGDQNATAMIQMVAHHASLGKAKAVAAYQAIKKYVETHPMRAAASAMHGDMEERAYQIGRVALANGPLVTIGAVMHAATIFAGEPNGYKAFTFGFAHFGMPQALGAAAKKVSGIGQYLRAGAMMAYARAVQRLRTPGSKVSDFSPNIGWELGE